MIHLAVFWREAAVFAILAVFVTVWHAAEHAVHSKPGLQKAVGCKWLRPFASPTVVEACHHYIIHFLIYSGLVIGH